jgi:hypothetical protein
LGTSNCSEAAFLILVIFYILSRRALFEVPQVKGLLKQKATNAGDEFAADGVSQEF